MINNSEIEKQKIKIKTSSRVMVFFKKLLTYEGAYNRIEGIVNWIIAISIMLIGPFISAFFESLFKQNWLWLITLILYLLAAYIQLCGIIKRLHDLGKSGWWWLLTVVPLLNVLFIFYLIFFRGVNTKPYEWNFNRLNGWKRLWVFVSAFYMVFAFWLAYIQGAEISDFKTVILFLTIPPLFLYLIGLCVAWVIVGFKERK